MKLFIFSFFVFVASFAYMGSNTFIHANEDARDSVCVVEDDWSTWTTFSVTSAGPTPQQATSNALTASDAEMDVQIARAVTLGYYVSISTYSQTLTQLPNGTWECHISWVMIAKKIPGVGSGGGTGGD